MYDYYCTPDEHLEMQYEDRYGDPDLDEDTTAWLESSDDDCDEDDIT